MSKKEARDLGLPAPEVAEGEFVLTAAYGFAGECATCRVAPPKDSWVLVVPFDSGYDSTAVCGACLARGVAAINDYEQRGSI